MTRTMLPPVQLLAMLRDSPARIATSTAGVKAERLSARPEPDEWSATEVLAHMRSCADMWGGAVTAMLAGERTVRAVNPRSWVKKTNYPTLDFRRSFRAYEKQRQELLTLLESLPRKDWSRSATVTGAGAPLTRTVHDYVQWLARHEQPHLKQIQEIVDAVR